MNYWIFKSNPQKYDIDSRLDDPNPEIHWRVSRYRKEIKAGDIAFIWRAGPPRGVIGAMRIESDPFFLPFDPNNPEWTGEYKVDGRIILHIPTLDSNYLKEVPGLENLSVFHGYQAATNFKVSHAEAEILITLMAPEDRSEVK